MPPFAYVHFNFSSLCAALVQEWPAVAFLPVLRAKVVFYFQINICLGNRKQLNLFWRKRKFQQCHRTNFEMFVISVLAGSNLFRPYWCIYTLYLFMFVFFILFWTFFWLLAGIYCGGKVSFIKIGWQDSSVVESLLKD